MLGNPSESLSQASTLVLQSSGCCCAGSNLIRYIWAGEHSAIVHHCVLYPLLPRPPPTSGRQRQLGSAHLCSLEQGLGGEGCGAWCTDWHEVD